MSAVGKFLAAIGAALSSPRPLPPARASFDPHQVTAAVQRYAHVLGLTESNTVAAIARALNAPGCTLECIRAGHKAADGFFLRQRQSAQSERA